MGPKQSPSTLTCQFLQSQRTGSSLKLIQSAEPQVYVDVILFDSMAPASVRHCGPEDCRSLRLEPKVHRVCTLGTLVTEGSRDPHPISRVNPQQLRLHLWVKSRVDHGRQFFKLLVYLHAGRTLSDFLWFRAPSWCPRSRQADPAGPTCRRQASRGPADR